LDSGLTAKLAFGAPFSIGTPRRNAYRKYRLLLSVSGIGRAPEKTEGLQLVRDEPCRRSAHRRSSKRARPAHGGVTSGDTLAVVEGAPILLLTGPPGAGKSTVARLVADRFERAACVESDWFWTTIVSGLVPPWLADADQQNRAVITACAAAAAELSRGGYTVVMNGIFGPWYLDFVTDGLRRHGGDVHYVVLRPGLEVAIERATSRAPLTPGIPPLTDEEPIRQMWMQFQNLGPLESHVIDNGAQDPEETASVVWTRFVNGSDRL
jgi:gluconate kinase